MQQITCGCRAAVRATFLIIGVILAGCQGEYAFTGIERDAGRLYPLAQGGANDVRDILILEDGFMVATGKGIARYRYTDSTPTLVREYARADGLPSDNCFELSKDAAGAIWVMVEGGVARLAPGRDTWQGFTADNDLPPGAITDMALSGDGRRIWVITTGGLATSPTDETAWQVYAMPELIDILVHPTEDVVWCRRLLGSDCMCGQTLGTSEFRLDTGKWRDVPYSENCSHAAPRPVAFCPKQNRLWFVSYSDPPLAYDREKGVTISWVGGPDWREVVVTGETELEVEPSFQDVTPQFDAEGRLWYATEKGLAAYDPSMRSWRRYEASAIYDGELRFFEGGLLRSCSGDTVYLADAEHLAALSMASNEWRLVWPSGGYLKTRDDRTFYPIGEEEWYRLMKQQDEGGGPWRPTDMGYIEMSRWGGEAPELVESPDGRSLWWFTGILMVCDPQGRSFRPLTNQIALGLDRAKLVRFDTKRQLALIATPRGVIGADYDGNVLFALSRSTCPISFPGAGLVFAPDGSEVWCMLALYGAVDRRVVVLHPDENRWEEFPDPRTRGNVEQFIFSRDGKLTWLLGEISQEGDGLWERTVGERQWRPFEPQLPGNPEHIYLTPDGRELWVEIWGRGMARVKLADRELTHYNKPPPGSWPHDGARYLRFTSDGDRAIFYADRGDDDSITVIDLATNDVRMYPIDGWVRSLAIVDDRWVEVDLERSPDKVLDLETGQWVASAEPKAPEEVQPDPEAEELEEIIDEIFQDAHYYNWPVEVKLPSGTVTIGVGRANTLQRCIGLFDWTSREFIELYDLGAVQVGDLALGPRGYVWAATAGGLIRIDPKTHEVTVFD